MNMNVISDMLSEYYMGQLSYGNDTARYFATRASVPGERSYLISYLLQLSY